MASAAEGAAAIERETDVLTAGSGSIVDDTESRAARGNLAASC